MRIISGEARGRKLYAPDGDKTRPTSDKLRGSLFNILNARIEDARVLDLFGGTGALALEAISRGAAYAVISDNARAAFDCIRRNTEAVLHGTDESRVRIIKADYRTAISQLGSERFDLVFLDPPYRMEESYTDAMTRLFECGALDTDAIIVAERRSDVCIHIPETFEIYDTRIYGETSIDFISLRNNE